MKNIELTEDHKSKLLEMCKELFPKLNLEMYYDNDIADNWKEALENNSCGNDAQVGYLISNWHKPNAKIIHWFEFCMTHLIVELSKEFTKQGLSKADYTNNQYPNWFSEKLSYHLNPFKNEEFEEDVKFIHPIDYLYEEFKKLK